MQIDIVTLFPDMFIGPFDHSILKRAKENNAVTMHYHQLRDYAADKHRTVDDTAYGGGSGMVMKVEPLFAVLEKIKKENGVVIYPSPKGQLFSHALAKELSEKRQLIFICGRYEGIDERVIDYWVDYEISIGNYVLTGGELPAMIMVDTIIRQIPGVVGKYESVINDSFYDGKLDFPHYTKPAEFRGLKVPDVLLSGNHQEIETWRKNRQKSV